MISSHVVHEAKQLLNRSPDEMIREENNELEKDMSFYGKLISGLVIYNEC
jgi:hypothetical protein